MEIDKSKITILIVDDTPENISILGEYFAEFKVKVALDGFQALEIIESGTIPSIILLDIMMPGIDGYEVCKRIKSNPLSEDIPIIFITSMSEVTDKIKGFQLGAVDYITKPFQLEEVKSRVATHVSLSLYRQKLEEMNSTLEQKVHERTHELLLSKEKAEEASKLKSHFLALMSHELRTPMVGILGYSEALIDELQDPYFKEFAVNLYESAERLKQTLESILTLTSLESKSQNTFPSLFNVDERISELMKAHKMRAEKKGLTVSLVNNSEMKEIILDKIMFDIIINNLVNNAVKYTQQGSIKIELFDEKINNTKYFCVKVTDTGIGIPKEKHEIIFEEFRQVYEGMKRNFEGVGLGLSLVKKYVEKLNGIINLESEVGVGSTFVVKFKPWENIEIIPKLNVPKTIATLKPKLNLDKKPKVLVVDDDKTNAEVTKLFLNELVDLDVAPDGPSAIQMVKKNNYAAILMDINLGKGLSGIDVTKIIKQIDHYKDTPIIAYTAFAMENDEKNFLEEGCTHYMAKPYKKKELIDLIGNIIYNE